MWLASESPPVLDIHVSLVKAAGARKLKRYRRNKNFFSHLALAPRLRFFFLRCTTETSFCAFFSNYVDLTAWHSGKNREKWATTEQRWVYYEIPEHIQREANRASKSRAVLEISTRGNSVSELMDINLGSR